MIKQRSRSSAQNIVLIFYGVALSKLWIMYSNNGIRVPVNILVSRASLNGLVRLLCRAYLLVEHHRMREIRKCDKEGYGRVVIALLVDFFDSLSDKFIQPLNVRNFLRFELFDQLWLVSGITETTMPFLSHP